VIRELLGGSVREGAIAWAGAARAGEGAARRFNTYTTMPTLQIDSADGLLLIRALRGRWHFPTVHGVVSRDLPVKNHPWSDLGDSFAYLVGGLAQSREPRDPRMLQRYAVSATSDPYGQRATVRYAKSQSAEW
jgi:hypothetical protein